jgi:glyoxylase-like metal-dependent hydrolase (beta-lactamase superfamily II)
MPLEILSLTLGPVLTNAYLIADSQTGEAAVIDPAWDGRFILAEAHKRNWRIGQMWYTHAHFDHIGGAAELAEALTFADATDSPNLSVALHPKDHFLWQMGGGGALFGYRIEKGPKPTIDLFHGQKLSIGSLTFEVRHTPGHTPGHCVFYCAEANTLFSGDLIFQNGVGRIDLPGGSWETLVESIRSQVFTLPEETRILSGHGGETRVGEEKRYNPFIQD